MEPRGTFPALCWHPKKWGRPLCPGAGHSSLCLAKRTCPGVNPGPFMPQLCDLGQVTSLLNLGLLECKTGVIITPLPAWEAGGSEGVRIK